MSKAKQRLQGLLYVALVTALATFIIEGEASETYWARAVTYSVEGCQPETVMAIDEVATELSVFAIPFTYQATDADIAIICSPISHLNGDPEAWGTTTRYWYQATNRLRNVDVWIDSDREHLNVIHTVRHELGHAVGLSHSLDPNSLMHAANDGVDYYDFKTLKVLIDKYGHRFAVMDSGANRYIPCQLVGEQFYWTLELNQGWNYAIYDYGVNDDACN